ncbi:MAG: oxygenase MpaB family protein [Pseudonocardia sp.]|nr:oxygenase MpaB family protein [Pseudonocardia sp.]
MLRTAPGRLPRTARDLVLAPVLLSATANVIMELALPPVGHGVRESTVTSGNLFEHPIKRFRTTNTYLGVALLGTDDERRAYRRAVNGSHAQVRSTEESPVAYHAMNRDLQLWVAACIYRAFEDTWGLLTGRPGLRLPGDVYRACAPIGTTLQVRPEQWPADRTAFDEYWAESLRHVSIDPAMRAYFERLMNREYLGPVGRIGLRRSRWFTTGFLHEPFRSMLDLPWSDADQREFEERMRRTGELLFRLPPMLRRLPYNACRTDLRVRRRLARPLV